MTRNLLFMTVAMVGLLMTMSANVASAADLQNTVYMDLKDGRVTILLEPKLAPRTVARFKELVQQRLL